MELAPRFLLAAAASMVLFNVVSVFAFGKQTYHTQMFVNAALIQLPATALGATALSLVAGRIRLAASIGSRAAAAAGLAALAIAARLVF
ncbi:MAG TPA: hypothetical protein PLZ86_07955 [bacterium]|nr:hypothetical protein [bacterium]